MRPVRIFKDRSKLLPGYVPERLVNREDEFRELVRFFKTTLTGEVGQRVLIHGPSGAGKTALARRFARELERVAEGKGTRMRHAYVDCRAQRSEFRVARKMAVSLGLKVPPTGISARQCLDRTAGFLEGKDSHLALVLDWLDFHVREEGADLLYFYPRQGDLTHKKIPFQITPTKTQVNPARIPQILLRAKQILEMKSPPPPSDDCSMCKWLEKVEKR